MTPDFKPADVRLDLIPLVDTMGRTEVELAAAMLVRTCQRKGEWYAPPSTDVGAMIKADVAEKSPHAKTWMQPIVQPDFGELVTRGFAKWTAEPFASPLELTEEGFKRLRPYVRS